MRPHRHFPTPQGIYLTVSIATRFVWLALALTNFVFHTVSVAAFTSELLVFVFLTFESHPFLLKGLDPKPEDDDNVFVHDRGLQILITVAVLAYLVPFSQAISIHLPHALGEALHILLPTAGLAWWMALVQAFSFGAVFGFYLDRAEPDGAVIGRIARSLLGIEPDDLAADELDEIERALRATERSIHQWRLVLFNAYAVGFVVAVATFLYALGVTALFLVPKLLAIVVVGWLLHDILQQRFDFDDGLGHFLQEVGEEIEQPKRWFLKMEMIEAGLKGVMTTLFIIIGIIITGLISSMVISIGASSIDALITALGQLQKYVTARGLGGLLADQSGTLAFVDAILLFITVGAIAPLIGCASAISWYVVLDRVPHWTRDFHYERATEAAEARPLSRRLLAGYVVAWALIPFALLVIDPVLREPSSFAGFALLGALLVLLILELVALGAIVTVVRSLDRQTIAAAELERDNHLILALVLVPLVAIVPLGSYPLRLHLGLLIIVTLAHYLPDVMHCINERYQSEILATVTFQAYVFVFIGTVYASRALGSLQELSVVRYLMWLIVVLFVLDWFFTLTSD